MFKKCAVIGLGLIGGSLAAVMKYKNLCEQIVAYTPRQDHLRIAEHLGYIDEGAVDLKSALKSADLVVIATPVAAFESVFQQISELPHDWFAPHLIMTDVASVKGSVIQLAKRYIPHLSFVPGHPIAGSENSGILAVNQHLFEKHLVVLTTGPQNNAADVSIIESLWQKVGAQVVIMPNEEHDRIFSITSHLPHLLAFSLVDTLAGDPAQQAIFQFAAGGFRDFTRIAASDPVMWHDIFFANKDNIIAAIEEFSEGLQGLKKALISDDHTSVMGVLTRSQAARSHFKVLLEQRAMTGWQTNSTSHSHIQYESGQTSLDTESEKSMSESAVEHFLVQPGGQVTGDVTVPGDKSISHRSIMFGALSEGITRIKGFLEGEDALATLQAFRDMGVVIEGPKDGEVIVHGVGLHGLKEPSGDIYVGNSGTTIRLLTGLLAAQQFPTRMIGDATIMRRPMGRVADPLTRMGAQIAISDKGTPPVEIRPALQQLREINYQMPVVSAQVKSAILLAGLYASGVTQVKEIGPARDHTERMLKAFGCQVDVDGQIIRLQGGQTLKGIDLTVPADISSAAFFMVAASIAPGSDICLKNVGMNPTRVGVIEILKLMGADLQVKNESFVGGEPVADIQVKFAQLYGIQIPEALVPLAIDEFPALFIAAACAKGITKLTGAEELRVKESDRIASMAEGLQTLGVQAQVQPDGIIIHGLGTDNPAASIFSGGEIETFGDHRIAMAFTISALRATQTILVKDVAHVATSFPGFMNLAQIAGLSVVSTAAS